VVEQGGDPYAELLWKFPHCDWEYMEKRENGQLLMDLGMGFHPNPEDTTPLVFLWDLKEVNQSYDTAGMNAGQVHHAGMMGRYGGRQSEMEQKRQAIVQLCFCSTYSLNYQPFRRSQAGEINLGEDIDAYEVNSTYRNNLESHIMMMQWSKHKSFDAREEMRGSGTSICQVMQDAASLVSNDLVSVKALLIRLTGLNQMKTYVEASNPILAVKSELYFRFQIRHMKELQNAQTHLSKYRPANYGTIMAVLMHMLCHILHSPVAQTRYLRDALRDLQFYKVMDTFGTFFLHELDLEKAVLPLYIEQEDSDECLLAMSQDKSIR